MEIIIGGKYIRKIFFLEAKYGGNYVLEGKIWREICFRGNKYTNGNVGIFRNINKERKLNLTIWEQSFLNLAFSSNLSWGLIAQLLCYQYKTRHIWKQYWYYTNTLKPDIAHVSYVFILKNFLIWLSHLIDKSIKIFTIYM